MGVFSLSSPSGGRYPPTGSAVPAYVVLATGGALAVAVGLLRIAVLSEAVVALAWLASVGAIAAGMLRYRPLNRVFWLQCIGAILAVTLAGLLTGVPAPTPAWIATADAFYLITFVLFVGAGLSLLPRRGHHRDWAATIDCVALGVAGAMPFWAFAVVPRLWQRMSFHTVLAAFVYPTFGLLLVVVGARLNLVRTGGFALRMVTLALAASIATNLWYLARTVNGTYAWGLPADALWVVIPAAMSAAALHPSMRVLGSGEAAPVHPPSWLRILVVGFGTFSVPIMISLVSYRNERLAQDLPGLVVGLVVLVIASVARTAQMVREARSRVNDLEALSGRLQVALDEQGRLQERLIQGAFYDDLTLLPNRRLFMDRLQHALTRLDRSGGQVGVLFVDLNGFKKLNDTFGHDEGDEALAALARRLSAVLRPSDTLARFGGDEFAVLLEPPVTMGSAHDVAGRMHRALQQPFDVAGHAVLLAASVGVRLGGGEDPAVLLRDADLAMYEAKRAHVATVNYDAAMHEHLVAQAQLEEDLHRGLPEGQFVLHYQPVVDLQSGRMVSVEGLVRWQHPQHGLMLPDDFLAAAQAIGIMPAISRWVFDEGCRWARAWQLARPDEDPLVLALNLSPRELADPGLLSMVREVLEATGLDPGCLSLEVTETAVLGDLEAALPALRALRAAGVSVALDDFGTGYSSLSHLRRLPVDAVKVDKSFVDGLGTELESSALVAALVGLAHRLSLKVVAEGVETPRQLAALQELGCEFGQGWLFSKAVEGRLVPETEAFVPMLVTADPVTANSLTAMPSEVRRHTVALVDDLEDDRRLLRRGLERTGEFAVVGEAGDGAAAVALAKDLQPELIVLDVRMPGLGGMEALPRILQASPGSQVILLSGYSTDALVAEAFEAGAVAFLEKGVNSVVDDVLRVVAEGWAEACRVQPGPC